MTQTKNKNKGGRPRLAEGEHRDKRVEVAFAKSEIDFLDGMRPCSGTRARFIRDFVLDGEQPAYREPVKPMTPELKKFQNDTARALSNINQIAKHLNSPLDTNMLTVFNLLIEIDRTLKTALDEFRKEGHL